MEAHVLKFPDQLSFTNEELFEFCVANEQLNIERDKYGQVWIMSPSGSNSGKLNLTVASQLYNWNLRSRLGVVFDSSAGFLLDDNAMRSPDAAWVSNEKWDKLTKKEKDKFAPVCPEFIMELRSPSDNLSTLKDKMYEWMDNGCQLAWLIDPTTETCWIYENKTQVQEVKGFHQKLSGSSVLPEFELELSLLLQ